MTACVWYMEHATRVCRFAASPQLPAWRPGRLARPLPQRHSGGDCRARRLGMRYAEVGGWAVAPEHRCKSEGLLLALAAYSLGPHCRRGARTDYRHRPTCLVDDSSTDRRLPPHVGRRPGASRTTIRGMTARWSCCGSTRGAKSEVRASHRLAQRQLAYVPVIASTCSRRRLSDAAAPAALRVAGGLTRRAASGPATTRTMDGSDFRRGDTIVGTPHWRRARTTATATASQRPAPPPSRPPPACSPSCAREAARKSRKSSASPIPTCMPIYPISTGKNWGYGSRVPLHDGVLVDLGRMNRIVDFDEELAYVTIEPGVTQRQLHAFLQERGAPRSGWTPPARVPTAASSATRWSAASATRPWAIIAATPAGWRSCCRPEMSSRPASAVSPARRQRPEPLGRRALARRAVLAVQPRHRHPHERVADARARALSRRSSSLRASEDGLGPVIDALRPLENGRHAAQRDAHRQRLQGARRDEPVSMGCNRRTGPARRRRAWPRIRRDASIGCWNGSGGLYGTRAQVREAKTPACAAPFAGRVDRLQFVDDRLLGLMTSFATPFRAVTRMGHSPDAQGAAARVRPAERHADRSTLTSAYWRKKTAMPAQMDPDRDGCGLLWCSPVFQTPEQHVTAVANLTTDSATRAMASNRRCRSRWRRNGRRSA